MTGQGAYEFFGGPFNNGGSAFIYTKSFFVHPNGDDTAAEEGNLSKPFKTIAGAVAASSSGDFIIPFPETYTETAQIYKSGVTISQIAGLVTINLSGQSITDSGVSGTYTMFGNITIVGDNVNDVFSFTGATTTTDINIWTIHNNGARNAFTQDGTHKFNINFWQCSNSRNVLANGSDIKLFFDDYDLSVGGLLLEVGNGTTYQVLGNTGVSGSAVLFPTNGLVTLAEGTIEIKQSVAVGFQWLTTGSNFKVEIRRSNIEGSRANRGVLFFIGTAVARNVNIVDCQIFHPLAGNVNNAGLDWSFVDLTHPSFIGSNQIVLTDAGAKCLDGAPVTVSIQGSLSSNRGVSLGGVTNDVFGTNLIVSANIIHPQ